MIGRNDNCWCGSGKKWKKCHFPELSTKGKGDHAIADRYLKQYKIILKTPEQIQGIKKACRLSAEILDKVSSLAKKGVTPQSTRSVCCGTLCCGRSYGGNTWIW